MTAPAEGLAPVGVGVTTRAYRGGVLVAESFAIEQVPDLVSEPGTVVWVDLPVPGGETALHRLAADLGVSDLVVEDALGRHERPRVDCHDGYLFANVYAISVATSADGSPRVRAREVSAVVLPTVLVTVRAGAGVDTMELVARWQERAGLLRHGALALLYSLLDLVVDGHFAAVQALDDEVEAVEDVLFEERSQRQVQQRTYRLRKALVRLRRAVLPMREVVATVLRHEREVSDGSLDPYLEDLYDHALRAAEWSEGLRDMVTTLHETNVSLQDHRLNVVIKKLTSWAAIIAVPTAITGFFGQNVTFPGEGSWSGLALSTFLIAATASGLYALFWRRDWI